MAEADAIKEETEEGDHTSALQGDGDDKSKGNRKSTSGPGSKLNVGPNGEQPPQLKKMMASDSG